MISKSLFLVKTRHSKKYQMCDTHIIYNRNVWTPLCLGCVSLFGQKYVTKTDIVVAKKAGWGQRDARWIHWSTSQISTWCHLSIPYDSTQDPSVTETLWNNIYRCIGICVEIGASRGIANHRNSKKLTVNSFDSQTM